MAPACACVSACGTAAAGSVLGGLDGLCGAVSRSPAGTRTATGRTTSSSVLRPGLTRPSPAFLPASRASGAVTAADAGGEGEPDGSADTDGSVDVDGSVDADAETRVGSAGAGAEADAEDTGADATDSREDAGADAGADDGASCARPVSAPPSSNPATTHATTCPRAPEAIG